MTLKLWLFVQVGLIPFGFTKLIYFENIDHSCSYKSYLNLKAKQMDFMTIQMIAILTFIAGMMEMLAIKVPVQMDLSGITEFLCVIGPGLYQKIINVTRAKRLQRLKFNKNSSLMAQH